MKLKDLEPGQHFVPHVELRVQLHDELRIYQKLVTLDGSPQPHKGECLASFNGYIWTMHEEDEVVICRV